MAHWKDSAVTRDGAEMLNEWMAGRKITITNAYGGTGKVDPQMLAEQTGLVDMRQRFHLLGETDEEDGKTVHVQIQNADVTEEYELNQLGVYAALDVDRDPGAEERLLFIMQDESGVTVPSSADESFLLELYCAIGISNNGRFEVSVSSAGVVTLEYMRGALEGALNKHNADPDAHPGILARMQATEIALNGSGTLTGETGPTAETAGTKGQHYINTKTGEEWECSGVNEAGEYIWTLIDRSSESFKSMRDILAEAAETAKQAKDVADGAAQAIAAVQNTISVIPSQSGSLTYNGGAQIPSWNNLALEMMDITYGEDHTPAADFKGETDAGTYKAYVKPKEGYTWGDKSSDEKEIPWTIQRATISTAPSPAGTLTYTGEAQAPTWQNFNPDQLTKEETTQADAGTHSTSFTPTANYQWSGGDTSARVISWTIERAVIADVPRQNGNPTYTGAAQSPTWDGYDSGKLTISGDTTGTDAGDYTASFTPTANYRWGDGSVAAKTAEWSIGKAPGTLSLDKTSITLNASAKFSTITVERAGDGAISAKSSNTGVATVSVSENTVLVTSGENGDAVITIEVAEGTNHTAPASKTCAVTVSIPRIYGASWDGTSTTKWTRTDDAAGFTDPVPYVKGASVYGSPFDSLQPWAGMVKSERTGGTMVAIPKFWYKLTQSGKGIKVQIADKATAGFSVSPAHMNRGDGKGERDVVYVGRYHCGASNYKSVSGQKPKASITRATARTEIHKLGTNIWQMDFATRFTLWLLYIVEFADWNSQKCIGYGCGNNSAPENMGYTDSMPYHTGTTQSSRTTYGLGTQYRNIEGLWDNVYDWCDGCYNSSAGLNIILNPNNFSDSSGGTSVGTPSSGWPSAFSVKTVSGLFALFIPTEANGNENTYSCDSWHFVASNPCVFVGGYYGQDGNHGLFFVSYGGVSSSNASIGSRSMELP